MKPIKKTEKTKFEPTTEQSKIFETIGSGTNPIMVSAVPGSGKTTTLVEGTQHLPNRVSCRFFTFTKNVASELQRKLPSRIKASTFHSLGYRIIADRWGSISVDNNKYRDILSDELKERNIRLNLAEYKQLNQLIEFVMLTFTTPTIEAIQSMNAEYGIMPNRLKEGIWEERFNIIKTVIGRGLRMERVVTGAEMLFLPLRWEAMNPGRVIPRFDYVFVDEAQDLNRAQLEFALRCAENGLSVFVGDPNQSCFSFQGADPRSVSKIIERTEATVLPLSTCWRCPTSHISEAKKFQPDSPIQSRPGAPVGSITMVNIKSLGSIVEPGDIVISRCLFPLFEVYIEFASAKIPVRFKAKDAVDSIKNTLRLFVSYQGLSEFDAMPLEQFSEETWHWLEEIKIEFEGENNSKLVGKCQDHIEALKTIYKSYQCENIQQLNRIVDQLGAGSLNSDKANQNGTNAVLLSSIHGAKGLEANRVVHVRDDLIPNRSARSETERQEEQNLAYIAWTRSRQEMILAR